MSKLAYYDEHLIKSLDLKEWRTQKEICDQIWRKYSIPVDARTWRYWVDIYNEAYRQGIRQTYIASSNKGYCITRRKQLIVRSEKRDLALAFGILKRVYRTRKARGESNNMRLNLHFQETADDVEVIEKWQ